MTGYPCEDCDHVFSLKSDLERHRNKKTPCIPKEKIISNHATEVVEKINYTEQINKVKKFLDFCHDLLRDKEGIVGLKALSNISMLLFLKFVSNSVKFSSIDLLNIETYRKEEGSDKNEMFQKYKDYIKYVQFSNIIENGKFKVDVSELIFIVEFIFKHILWYHPKTKNIFTDELPSIKNDITYEQIFKQMDKLNWDDFDIDVKGLAYEHFLKYEMAGGELGQFFTKREIINYIINIVKPNITKDSTFIDPFCGTGGFLTNVYNTMKEYYKKNNIPMTDEIKNNMINGIEKNPQTLLLALNNLLLHMDLFSTNIKCDDSFRNYIKNKYDFVLTNPPFGIKLKYDDKTFLDKIGKIKKNEYLPIKSNDAICLSIQMIQYILKNNGIASIIVPDGKQLTNTKEKSIIEVRKMLVENNDLFQITKLPNGSFLPFTAVDVAILFFKKGTKTKNIKIVKLDNKFKNETLLCNISMKELIKNNYSFNSKLYEKEINIYTEIIHKKIKDIFVFSPKSKKQASYGSDIGEYPFYTSSQQLTKYSNDYDYEDVSIIIGTGGNVNVKFDKKFSCSADNLILKLNNNEYNIKYFYYYLLLNIDKLDNLFHGTTIKHISKSDLENLEIPIPSILIQNKIVSELDSNYKIFNNTKSLIENIDEQKKFKFECDISKLGKKSIDIKKINSIVNFQNKSKRLASFGNEIGKYPFYTSSSQLSKYCDEYDYEDEYIIIGTGGNVNIKFDKNFSCSGDNLIINSNCDEIKTKYIYYYLLNNIEIVNELFHGTTIKHLSKNDFENLNITIPSIEDQESIIKEMEYFDNLKEMYQTHIINTEKQIKERFEYHLSKCKNVVLKDANESKEDNNDNTETEESDEDEKIVKRTKSSKSKNVIESDSEEKKPIKKSKVEKELETDTEDEKLNKKSNKKINKSTKKN